MQDLTEKFETAFSKDGVSEIDTVTSRRCSSDRFDGIEYNVTGYWVDVVTMMKVVATVDEHSIESISYCSDGDSGSISVFVAYVPEVGPVVVDF